MQLAIASTETVEIITVDKILYLASDGRYTIFHLADNLKRLQKSETYDPNFRYPLLGYQLGNCTYPWMILLKKILPEGPTTHNHTAIPS